MAQHTLHQSQTLEHNLHALKLPSQHHRITAYLKLEQTHEVQLPAPLKIIQKLLP